MNRIVQYWCKPDWCTNGSVVQQINEAVQEYYDLSPLYEILNIKNRITSQKPSSTETSSIFTSKYIASTIFHRSTLTSPKVLTTNTVQDTFNSDDVSKSTSIFTSKTMLLTSQTSNLINNSITSATTFQSALSNASTLFRSFISFTSDTDTSEPMTTKPVPVTITSDITTTTRIIISSTTTMKNTINTSINAKVSYSTVSITVLSNAISDNTISIETENNGNISNSFSVSINLILLAFFYLLL